MRYKNVKSVKLKISDLMHGSKNFTHPIRQVKINTLHSFDSPTLLNAPSITVLKFFS